MDQYTAVSLLDGMNVPYDNRKFFIFDLFNESLVCYKRFGSPFVNQFLDFLKP